MGPRVLPACLVALPCALWSGAASAQGGDPSAAVVLFDEAQTLAAAGNYAAACAKFAESNRLDPQLGALMHLADCLEKEGRFASAWASFRAAADVAQQRGDERGQVAAERAAALEPRLSRLAIVVRPEAALPGLEVRRDGVPIGPALWGSAIPMDPGEHTLEATAPGKIPWRVIVRAGAPGSSESITVPLLVDPAAPAPPPAAPPTPTPEAPAAAPLPAPDTGSPVSTQKVLGWTAAGLGVVGLGAGVYFMARRSSKLTSSDEICPTSIDCPLTEQERSHSLRDEARSATTIGSIALVGGGVLLAGGLVLVFTAPSGPEQVAVTPVLGPGFQGVTVTSRIW